ncbi:MAG: sigma-70 family RNA polymerase sigma factor [Leptospira sp.]|nr:sigma-70 family RNA polymerase sigma factor [Leptospira sp.]NCS95420.1 sigma-70 family RNA polymerase sigma factor [Leptospira sp.]
MLDKKLSMEKLYASAQKRIYDFLFKYTRNSDTAMDLTQDTFLSFFKTYSEQDLSEEKSIMLLYTIARNRSINFAKKFSTMKENSALNEEIHATNTSFEKRLEWQDLESKLWQCLDYLNEDERCIIELRHIQDYNLTQISEIMGISVSTASRMVVKATSNLLKLAEEKKINLET